MEGGSRNASFQAAFALFEAVCDLPADERRVLLERECGDRPALRAEVEELLAADADDGWESPLVASEELLRSAAAPPAPERLGGYEIVRALGEGGMGVVYEAVQLSPRRRVALKLLHGGLMTEERLRRFEHEAQVLGWLNHPGIARIYESGIAETEHGPRPFLAMELVEGERVDRWLAGRRSTPAQTLALVARICDAVQHAHQKGVIHRDLKPANILIDASGQPKVLDFGVARITNADLEATRQDTLEGQILGTLSYMSPEQVRADPTAIDTRADVYALGVLAYELLSGERPYRIEACALHEAARVIVEDEPTTLGGLDSRWKGDVEVLVAKAMAKEKERRYGSADELASDIRRHLAHEPILARRIGGWARLTRFARRNKALVGGLAAVFVSLSVGVALSTSLFLSYREEARRKQELSQRYRAEARANEELSQRYRREAETANRTVTFLEQIFEGGDPLAEEELSVQDLVDRTAERIRTELDVDSAVRGRLLSVLGGAYNAMGLAHAAEPFLREALDLRRETHGETSLEYADVLERLGQVERMKGRIGVAEELQRRVVATRTAHLGEDHPEVASAWNNLANILANDGRHDEALTAYDRALAIGGGDDAEPLLIHRLNRAATLFDLGRFAEAEESFRDMLLEAEGDPALQSSVMVELGTCLKSQRRLEEAEAWLRDAVTLCETTYRTESSDYQNAQRTLATVLTDTGRLGEAEEILRGLVAQATRLYGPDDGRTMISKHDLAYCLHDVPAFEEAEALYREVIDVWSRAYGSDHIALAMPRHNLGVLYSDRGRYDEAETYARAAYEQRAAILGPEHPNTLISKGSLATILSRMDELEEAEALARERLRHEIQVQGRAAVLTQHARYDLGVFLAKRGRLEPAHAVLLEAWELVPRMPEPDELPAMLTDELARVCEALERADEARVWRERWAETQAAR